MSDHGDFAECHGISPTCGCVAQTYPYDEPDAAKRHAAAIGGTVECVPEDPDSTASDEVWEVRYPKAKPRTFIVRVTEEKVTKYRLTLDEAMTLFPEVRWDEEDVSHAADMEDETYANAALPPGFKELDADDTDESIGYRIWEE